jgi:hypothetical protein
MRIAPLVSAALKAVSAALKAVSAALKAVSAALKAVSAALKAVSAALKAAALRSGKSYSVMRVSTRQLIFNLFVMAIISVLFAIVRPRRLRKRRLPIFAHAKAHAVQKGVCYLMKHACQTGENTPLSCLDWQRGEPFICNGTESSAALLGAGWLFEAQRTYRVGQAEWRGGYPVGGGWKDTILPASVGCSSSKVCPPARRTADNCTFAQDTPACKHTGNFQNLLDSGIIPVIIVHWGAIEDYLARMVERTIAAGNQVIIVSDIASLHFRLQFDGLLRHHEIDGLYFARMNYTGGELTERVFKRFHGHNLVELMNEMRYVVLSNFMLEFPFAKIMVRSIQLLSCLFHVLALVVQPLVH